MVAYERASESERRAQKETRSAPRRPGRTLVTIRRHLVKRQWWLLLLLLLILLLWQLRGAERASERENERENERASGRPIGADSRHLQMLLGRRSARSSAIELRPPAGSEPAAEQATGTTTTKRLDNAAWACRGRAPVNARAPNRSFFARGQKGRLACWPLARSLATRPLDWTSGANALNELIWQANIINNNKMKRAH